MLDFRIDHPSIADLDKLPIEEIVVAVRSLQSDIRRIEDRLARKGEQKTAEFRDWRRRMLPILQTKLGIVSRTNEYLKGRRRAEYLEGAVRLTSLNPGDLPALCGALLRLTRSLMTDFEEDEVTKEERALVMSMTKKLISPMQTLGTMNRISGDGLLKTRQVGITRVSSYKILSS